MFEEIQTAFGDGTLAEKENKFINEFKGKDYPEFSKNFVYSSIILEKHLKTLKEVHYLDDINSAITRCIEYNLVNSLILLLKSIPSLLSKASFKDNVIELDRNLMLRKANLNCYLISKKYGFFDRELEKRMTLFQRKFKKQDRNNITFSSFVIPSESNPLRYWGYRQALYWIKWNKKKRYQLLKRLKESWQNDCRYEAYLNSLESNNEILFNSYVCQNK